MPLEDRIPVQLDDQVPPSREPDKDPDDGEDRDDRDDTPDTPPTEPPPIPIGDPPPDRSKQGPYIAQTPF